MLVLLSTMVFAKLQAVVNAEKTNKQIKPQNPVNDFVVNKAV